LADVHFFGWLSLVTQMFFWMILADDEWLLCVHQYVIAIKTATRHRLPVSRTGVCFIIVVVVVVVVIIIIIIISEDL